MSTEAWMNRKLADGSEDTSFSTGGVWTLPPFATGGWYLGHVASNGDAWALRYAETSSDTAQGPVTWQPLRNSEPSIAGETQALLGWRSLGFDGGYQRGSVRSFADGGMQSVFGLRGSQGDGVYLLRWDAAGQAVAGMSVTPVPVGTESTDEDLESIDTVIDSTGRTVVAASLWRYSPLPQATLIRILRLNADGSRDGSFGTAGAIDIGPSKDGSANPVGRTVRLVLQADGKIVLGYNIKNGEGSAIVVARFLANGQPDAGFTTAGGHEAVFAWSGAELLQDIKRGADGKFVIAGQSGKQGLLIRLWGEATPPASPSVPVVEFFNTNLNHYFSTGGTGEIAAIESGAAGPGWSRTGLGFKAYAPETGIAPGAQPVCRFYGTPGVGPNSHFYTVDPVECELVKRDPGWTYEGTAFYIVPPTYGQCAPTQQPVYRAYNLRFAQNDSNHRYTTDAAVYGQMQAQGWAGEGVKFCAPN